MIVKNPKFEISAVSPKQYPTKNLPEVVLAGKSNVRKIFFYKYINKQKEFSKDKPRATEKLDKLISITLMMNFILQIYLDMGIVRCQKLSKIKFGRFIEEYLFSREEIELIILILDIRHKPTENDKLMYEYIKKTNKPYIIIANKADKVAVTKVENSLQDIKKELKMEESEIILPFSAERKIYTEEVWKNINNWSE